MTDMVGAMRCSFCGHAIAPGKAHEHTHPEAFEALADILSVHHQPIRVYNGGQLGNFAWPEDEDAAHLDKRTAAMLHYAECSVRLHRLRRCKGSRAALQIAEQLEYEARLAIIVITGGEPL